MYLLRRDAISPSSLLLPFLVIALGFHYQENDFDSFSWNLSYSQNVQIKKKILMSRPLLLILYVNLPETCFVASSFQAKHEATRNLFSCHKVNICCNQNSCSVANRRSERVKDKRK